MAEARAAIAAWVALVVAGCAGATVTTRNPTGSGPEVPPVVTLKAAGVEPTILHIFSREQATFVNNDGRPHDLVADRSRNEGVAGCDGVGVGLLQPGESRRAAVLPTGVVCYYRDAGDPQNVGFQGLVLMHY
jgi:plastocyanin